MAKLKLFHQGQLLKELELNSSEEYFAGRSSQAHFILEYDRGISRQHVRIAYENDVWTVTLMSKFGGLICGGKAVEQIRLDSDIRFSIPPYEFEFQYASDNYVDQARVSDQPLPVEEKDRDPNHIDDPSDPRGHVAEGVSKSGALVPATIATPENIDDSTNGGNFEATKIGISTIVPFLRIMNRSNGHEEILKLEGHVWTAGRHPDSEIYINDNSISRKHFEITRTNAGFFISDQKSSNGTTINDERILPGEPHKLISGDVITIRNIQITFEVHDTAFEQKIKNLPAVIDTFDSSYDPDGLEVSDATPSPQDDGSASDGPAVIKVQPKAAGLIANWQQHKMRFAIGALVLVTLLGYFFSGGESTNSKSGPENSEGGVEMGSVKEISEQDHKIIKEKYELAKKSLKNRGNYALCIEYMDDIMKLDPSFNDSINVRKLCEQGMELNMVNQERALKEQKKSEAENKIVTTVANCQSQYDDKITLQKMEECLSEAIELDPQNAGTTELLNRVRMRDQQKADLAVRERENAELVARARSHYKRAADFESHGELRKALTEYSKFLTRNYPGVKNQQESARRSVANIQQNLNQKVSERISSCKLYIEKSEFKAALKACDEALKEDPTNNDAKEMKSRAKSEMSRGLKSVYEDSVLEESLGNIEAAKEKWKTIMGNSYGGENFYEKAKSKLKKYGG